MECRKCSCEISGDEYRMVAEWTFCLPCFEQLLNKPTPPPAVELPPAAEPLPAEPPLEQPLARMVVVSSSPGKVEDPPAGTDQHNCLLCAREIPAGEQQWLASWVFCPTCFTTLVSQPPPPDEPAGPWSTKSPLDPPSYVTPTTCAGCGRRIPERGGKEIEGERYCPDCAAARSGSAVEPRPGLAARVQVVARVAMPEASPGQVCESCGRQVASGSLQTVEGFDICQACLSADADLALHLARRRHQLYLQQLARS